MTTDIILTRFRYIDNHCLLKSWFSTCLLDTARSGPSFFQDLSNPGDNTIPGYRQTDADHFLRPTCGSTLSFMDATGPGSHTTRTPEPFLEIFFNSQRFTMGEICEIKYRNDILCWWKGVMKRVNDNSFKTE